MWDLINFVCGLIILGVWPFIMVKIYKEQYVPTKYVVLFLAAYYLFNIFVFTGNSLDSLLQ